jgi:hypothetical protein
VAKRQPRARGTLAAAEEVRAPKLCFFDNKVIQKPKRNSKEKTEF